MHTSELYEAAGLRQTSGALLRHEIKYRLNYWQYAALKKYTAERLSPDAYAGADGRYLVRSLYFDTPARKDYRDKVNGAFERRKLRLRTYGGGEQAVYKLEEKFRRGELMGKNAVLLPRDTAEKVMRGDYGDLLPLSDAATRLYALLTAHVYRPVVTVSYTREAFYHAAQDLRVTFDSDIRFGSAFGFAAREDCAAQTSPHEQIIMEVKYGVDFPKWLGDEIRRCGAGVGTKSKYTDSLERLYD